MDDVDFKNFQELQKKLPSTLQRDCQESKSLWWNRSNTRRKDARARLSQNQRSD
jgi:hypothetical protein